jgi:hypothetical protein
MVFMVLLEGVLWSTFVLTMLWFWQRWLTPSPPGCKRWNCRAGTLRIVTVPGTHALAGAGRRVSAGLGFGLVSTLSSFLGYLIAQNLYILSPG